VRLQWCAFRPRFSKERLLQAAAADSPDAVDLSSVNDIFEIVRMPALHGLYSFVNGAAFENPKQPFFIQCNACSKKFGCKSAKSAHSLLKQHAAGKAHIAVEKLFLTTQRCLQQRGERAPDSDAQALVPVPARPTVSSPRAPKRANILQKGAQTGAGKEAPTSICGGLEIVLRSEARDVGTRLAATLGKFQPFYANPPLCAVKHAPRLLPAAAGGRIGAVVVQSSGCLGKRLNFLGACNACMRMASVTCPCDPAEMLSSAIVVRGIKTMKQLVAAALQWAVKEDALEYLRLAMEWGAEVADRFTVEDLPQRDYFQEGYSEHILELCMLPVDDLARKVNKACQLYSFHNRFAADDRNQRVLPVEHSAHCARAWPQTSPVARSPDANCSRELL